MFSNFEEMTIEIQVFFFGTVSMLTIVSNLTCLSFVLRETLFLKKKKHVNRNSAGIIGFLLSVLGYGDHGQKIMKVHVGNWGFT
jgi:hypothetical protein